MAIIGAIAAGIVLALSQIANLMINLKGHRQAATAARSAEGSAQNAAVEVKEVKTVLNETKNEQGGKLDQLAVVLDKTHTFVNSNMEIQLDLNERLARRVWEVSKHTSDKEVWEAAKRKLEEHRKNQRIVDAGEKTLSTPS